MSGGMRRGEAVVFMQEAGSEISGLRCARGCTARGLIHIGDGLALRLSVWLGFDSS